MNAAEWKEEADFIRQCAAYSPPLHFENFNNNMFCFRRYMRMQQRAAAREGFTDIAADIRETRIYLRASVQS